MPCLYKIWSSSYGYSDKDKRFRNAFNLKTQFTGMNYIIVYFKFV